SGAYDIGLTVISSHDIRGASVDVNAIYTRTSVGRADASNTALWTFSAGLPVTDKLGWALELFGQPTIDGSGTPSSVAVLMGPTYVISTAFSVDAGFIAPLRGEVPNSIYAGMVWNVG